jgi:biotin operon repressor
VVQLYNPYNPQETFGIPVEGASSQQAREKALGRVVSPPNITGFTAITTFSEPFESFKVEDAFIIGVYPDVRTFIKRPACRVMEPTLEKPLPTWLLGAWTDKPLCKGSMPFRSPYVIKKVSNSFTTLIFEQKIKSPDYPDVEQHINFKRDFLTPFLLEARTRPPKEAVRYLLEQEGPLTSFQISSALGLTSNTVNHNLEALTEEGQITRSNQKFHSQVLYYPKHFKTEEEKLREATGILQLKEHRGLKIEEQEQLRQTIREHEKEIETQTILPWLEEVEAPQPQPKTRIMETINIQVYSPESGTVLEQPQAVPVAILDNVRMWLPSETPKAADPRYEWTCQEAIDLRHNPIKYKNYYMIKCVAEIAGLTTEQYWLSPQTLRKATAKPPPPPPKPKTAPAYPRYHEFLGGAPSGVPLPKKEHVEVAEKPKIKVKTPTEEYMVSEETISQREASKLQWKPTKYSIAEPAYDWNCAETPYRDKTLVKCIAETPEHQEVQKFFVMG